MLFFSLLIYFLHFLKLLLKLNVINKLWNMCIDSGCGGSLTANTGVFTSPGHPNYYPHGVTCTWFITVRPGFLIRLTFTSFALESHSQCNYDYVQVFDNYTTAGSVGRSAVWCSEFQIIVRLKWSQEICFKSVVFKSFVWKATVWHSSFTSSKDDGFYSCTRPNTKLLKWCPMLVALFSLV